MSARGDPGNRQQGLRRDRPAGEAHREQSGVPGQHRDRRHRRPPSQFAPPPGRVHEDRDARRGARSRQAGLRVTGAQMTWHRMPGLGVSIARVPMLGVNTVRVPGPGESTARVLGLSESTVDTSSLGVSAAGMPSRSMAAPPTLTLRGARGDRRPDQRHIVAPRTCQPLSSRRGLHCSSSSFAVRCRLRPAAQQRGTTWRTGRQGWVRPGSHAAIPLGGIGARSPSAVTSAGQDTFPWPLWLGVGVCPCPLPGSEVLLAGSKPGLLEPVVPGL